MPDKDGTTHQPASEGTIDGVPLGALVVVRSKLSAGQVEILKGVLQSAGIFAFASNTNMSAIHPAVLSDLFVLKADMETALDVLKNAKRAASAKPATIQPPASQTSPSQQSAEVIDLAGRRTQQRLTQATPQGHSHAGHSLVGAGAHSPHAYGAANLDDDHIACETCGSSLMVPYSGPLPRVFFSLLPGGTASEGGPYMRCQICRTVWVPQTMPRFRSLPVATVLSLLMGSLVIVGFIIGYAVLRLKAILLT